MIIAEKELKVKLIFRKNRKVKKYTINTFIALYNVMKSKNVYIYDWRNGIEAYNKNIEAENNSNIPIDNRF